MAVEQTASRREVFLFPLGSVLFPGGALPLRIFEQRYLEMTKACLRDNLPFGVCLIREGREVGTPAVPYRTGCLATIEHWDMPHTGMFHLLARGSTRFRVHETHAEANGLLSGEVELLPDLAPAEADPTCVELLRAMVEKIGEVHFPQPLRYADAAWVVYRLTELLPVDAALRQHLLELDDVEALIVEFKKSVLKQILT